MSLDGDVNANQVAENAEKIRAIKAKVEVLQVHVMSYMNKPFYKQASVIIAALALLFSFSTTIISIYRTNQQDNRAMQQELRSLVQRITLLPRDKFKILHEYGDHPEASELQALINNENLILSQEAEDLIYRMPKKLVLGAEYYAVGQGLAAEGMMQQAMNLLKKAALNTENYRLAVAAYRSLGVNAYKSGQIQEGQEAFRTALNLHKAGFENTSQPTQVIEVVDTLEAWAEQALMIGDCDDSVKRHLQQARKYLLQANISSEAPVFELIQEQQKRVDACITDQKISFQNNGSESLLQPAVLELKQDSYTYDGSNQAQVKHHNTGIR